ncbi:von Willebrand factor type A domain-containing protein [Streptomyces phytohabitans]|uniref:vWA domain-containing protein n=1 Tax=Streptomyces phytohabitans TaxID=1150371 RepID=UPI00345B6756
MGHRGRRFAVALAAGGVLLAGCTGGGTDDGGGGGRGNREAATDRSDGGQVAPPPGGTSRAPDGARRDTGDEAEGDAPPAADLRSTFALDVDTASYGYAKRTVAEGGLPRPDTVRAEEFVNSFRPGYEQPEGDGFAVSADGARTGPTADGHAERGDKDGDWSLLRIGLTTRAEREDAAERRAPAALTFVVDVSGSMAEPGRLDLVRASLRTAVGQLRDTDSVALVAFSDEARTVLPMTRLGDDGGRGTVRDALDGLRTEDSTNLAAGMRTGYAEAVEGLRKGATNRVVLLSDALANTGGTAPDAILDQVAAHRADHGITLFGVGVGSDYGDALMERLTNRGDGHTTYVSSRTEARRVFVEELPRNIGLRARDAKAQVTFDPDTVVEQRLVGYDDRRVADEDFRDDRVDGGEIGPGHTVTALYAVRLREGGEGDVATAAVRWLDPDSRAPREETRRIGTDALDGALWESASPRLRTAAAAAYFAEALRGGAGDLPGAPPLRRLAGYARDAAADSGDSAVAELAATIRRADALGAPEGGDGPYGDDPHGDGTYDRPPHGGGLPR